MRPSMCQRYLNMDVVRYVLSLAVIVAHYNIIMGADIPFPISSGTAVGVFFGLSGYLVYGSYLKHPNFSRYIFSRMKRILPPYWFIVCSCAFGLCFISSLSVVDFFMSKDFWQYLVANLFFMNFLHPDLPGVFDGMDISVVNGSLWTLKVEWALYLSIPIFFWGVKRYRWSVPLTIVIICLCSVLYNQLMTFLAGQTNNVFFRTLSYQFVGQLTYFYTGVLTYHYRARLEDKHWQYIFLLTALCYLVFEGNIIKVHFPLSDIIAAVVLTFTTIWFSISRRISQYTSLLGNVSYEMYLFHFPIIQLGFYLQLYKYVPGTIYFALVLLCIIVLSVAFHKIVKY